MLCLSWSDVFVLASVSALCVSSCETTTSGVRDVSTSFYCDRPPAKPSRGRPQSVGLVLSVLQAGQYCRLCMGVVLGSLPDTHMLGQTPQYP